MTVGEQAFKISLCAELGIPALDRALASTLTKLGVDRRSTGPGIKLSQVDLMRMNYASREAYVQISSIECMAGEMSGINTSDASRSFEVIPGVRAIR
jgi:hypothetical protein